MHVALFPLSYDIKSMFETGPLPVEVFGQEYKHVHMLLFQLYAYPFCLGLIMIPEVLKMHSAMHGYLFVKYVRLSRLFS